MSIDRTAFVAVLDTVHTTTDGVMLALLTACAAALCLTLTATAVVAGRRPRYRGRHRAQ